VLEGARDPIGAHAARLAAVTMRERAFPGKLNLFQRMMLRWRSLHPYNAVHVARVARAFDAELARERIAATLARWGIGGFTLDAARRRYVYRGGVVAPQVDVLECASPSDGERVLAAEIARQLNTPFELGEPLRFFVVRMRDAFLLGVAYDHFLAGGDSVAALLGAIIVAMMRDEARGVAAVDPPSLYPPTYARLLRTHTRWFVAALAAMPALMRESKHALRTHDRDADDPRNAYVLIRVAPTDAAALRRQAADFGVTLHDLVIALLLRSLSPFAAARHAQRTRRGIAVASIVNIRKDFGGIDASAFGQLLASLRVMHPVPEGIGIAELARDVRSATLPIKRRHLYLRTLFGLAAASCAWPLMSDRQRSRFYAKHHPAWAGVSMLDVDPLWPAAAGSAQSYTRGVSTGPLTPAVLAISTTAAEISIGVSWRPTALSNDFPERLRAEIEQCARD